MTEGRKATRASKSRPGAPLSARSGSATGYLLKPCYVFIIKAFISHHFCYCAILCGISLVSKQDSDKLDLLNKRVLLFNIKDFNSEYNNLLKMTGTANLKDKRLQNVMILTIFKCLHFSNYPKYQKHITLFR